MTNTIELNHIVKTFGETRAVNDVSLHVKQGEIFGLLGPNGAGKTTAIRIMLDIFKPDSGTVAILGGAMDAHKKDRIGYMPEERGLYQESQLERCLVHLASLKGLSRATAVARLSDYLQQFDLTAHKDKKVKELSKGMQQKAQIINTIIHQPDLIIIDEPFTGLDPVNTQMVKNLIKELRDQGATIVMSTHQMHQVEALCDRIVLINRGQVVLEGELGEIQRRFSGHAVQVRTMANGVDWAGLSGVTAVTPNNKATHLTLEADTTPQAILQELLARQIAIEKFEIAAPTLDEIFIQVVKGEKD